MNMQIQFNINMTYCIATIDGTRYLLSGVDCNNAINNKVIDGTKAATLGAAIKMILDKDVPITGNHNTMCSSVERSIITESYMFTHPGNQDIVVVLKGNGDVVAMYKGEVFTLIKKSVNMWTNIDYKTENKSKVDKAIEYALDKAQVYIQHKCMDLLSGKKIRVYFDDITSNNVLSVLSDALRIGSSPRVTLKTGKTTARMIKCVSIRADHHGLVQVNVMIPKTTTGYHDVSLTSLLESEDTVTNVPAFMKV